MSQNEITLRKWTGIEDMMSWRIAAADETRITVTRDACFQLLFEGVFIGIAQEIRRCSKKLVVGLTVNLTSILNAEEIDPIDWPECLTSIGVIGLVYAADAVLDSTGNDVRSALCEAIWEKTLLRSEGVLGDGKRQSVVCRFPGAAVPRCLRDSPEFKVPSHSKFEWLLRDLALQMGASLGNKSDRRFFDSATETEVSSFLFEAFRNVIEHTDQDAQPGIWGLIVEKIIFTQSESVGERSQVPRLLHSYIEHAFSRSGKAKNRSFVSITVADYGRGIQNTLPAFSGESGWERLLRAFERGVSRKPKSGSPDWGQGLPNIASAVRRLNAILFVRSADEFGVLDLSIPQNGWVRLAAESPEFKNTPGTNLTVVWMVGHDTPDQGVFNF